MSENVLSSGSLCWKCWTPSHEEEALLHEVRTLGTNRIIVFYDWVPRGDTSGTDLRLMFLLETLVAAGQDVTLVCRMGREDEPDRRGILEQMGVQLVVPKTFRHDDGGVIDLLRKGAFDHVILFHWYWGDLSVSENYLPAVRKYAQQARVVLLIDEFGWARDIQSQASGSSRLVVERARGCHLRDRHLVPEVDLILALCDEDAERARGLYPDARTLPLGYGYAPIPEEGPGFDERDGIVFVGTGTNGLNRLMVGWLLTDVLPLLRAEVPDAKLYLVGPPPKEGWFKGVAPGVEVVGHVSDLHAFLQRRRVMVAPVPFGTGLRSKAVGALCAGLPVVTTPAGAEGMGPDRDRVVFVRSGAPAIAEALARVSTDRGTWESLARNALPYARERFGRGALLRDIKGWLTTSREISPRPYSERVIGPALRIFMETAEPMATAQQRTRVSCVGRMERAHRLFREANFEDALNEIRFAYGDLVGLPGDWNVFAHLHGLCAKSYLALGHVEEAEACLDYARAVDANAPDVLEAAAELARIRPAVTLAAPPEDMIREGEALFAAGKIGEAAAQFVKTLEKYPRIGLAWNNLGVALNAMGQKEEALSALGRALALKPELREARMNCVDLLISLGRRDEAAGELREALRRDPKDEEARRILELLQGPLED